MKRLHVPLLVVLATLPPRLAAEAPSLDSVTVEARAAPGSPTAVTMTYFLRPAGQAAVGFSSIEFGRGRAANVRAFLEGREVSFRAAVGHESKADGRVELAPRLRELDRIRLRLEYEVLPAWRAEGGSLPIPLLVVEWPPEETLPGTFRATAHLPADVFLETAFPTRFERVEAIDRTSTGNAYRFELPVVPALLRLETGFGEPSLLTGARGVDLVVAAALVGLAALGWRRMRESLR